MKNHQWRVRAKFTRGSPQLGDSSCHNNADEKGILCGVNDTRAVLPMGMITLSLRVRGGKNHTIDRKGQPLAQLT